VTGPPEYVTPPLLDVPDGGPVDDPGFVARQTLPPSNAWGGTAAQQAHMEGSCVPAGCRYCAAAEATKTTGEPA
jgi:hypothetical protein